MTPETLPEKARRESCNRQDYKEDLRRREDQEHSVYENQNQSHAAGTVVPLEASVLETGLPPKRIWINEGFWHQAPLHVGDIEYTRVDPNSEPDDPDFTQDEELIAEAVREARHIQEFIWGAESRSQQRYDAEAWRVIFQKRVDAISHVNPSLPAAIVELRKRLLQQAALSIKALVALRQRGLVLASKPDTKSSEASNNRALSPHCPASLTESKSDYDRLLQTLETRAQENDALVDALGGLGWHSQNGIDVCWCHAKSDVDHTPQCRKARAAIALVEKQK